MTERAKVVLLSAVLIVFAVNASIGAWLEGPTFEVWVSGVFMFLGLILLADGAK